MRVIVRCLLVASLLVSTGSLPLAVARAAAEPCDVALRPADVPSEMWPEPASGASLNHASDPTMCERLFRAEPPGPSGISLVRSLVIFTGSVSQAEADFAEYRALLVQAGWEPGPVQPLGDEAQIFLGSDPEDGIYTVQQLFRRGSVLVVTEATGPALEYGPGIVLDLSRTVDTRLSLDLGASFVTPLARPSIWPSVRQATIVADVRLTASTPMGQRLEESLQLGGLSGLVSLDREGTKFIAVTDRGPYADLDTGKRKLMVVPLPAYTPSILKLEVRNNQLRVIDRLGLRLADGYTNPRTGSPYVTGLPNSDSDPAAFDRTGRNRWGTDPYGVDPEGIAVDPRDGSFWICEEYGPSILHVDSDGTILLRLVPVGVYLNAPGQNVRGMLPPELARRQADRGFEGVAISPDGSRLFAIMQSPLASSDRPTGQTSRFIRLVTLDLTGGEPVVDGMYVYKTENFAEVGAVRQDDIRIGDMVALTSSRLLVAERDSRSGGAFKMVYEIDLASASNVLGMVDFGGNGLEQNDEHQIYNLGIETLPKRPLVNLAALGWQPESFEGLTVVDESTIAVVDDNNYGFGGYDSRGQPQSNGILTRLTVVHLPGSLR